MKAVQQPDYSTVTEQPGQRATRLQLDMMATRYGWAAIHAAGKDVLEAACGAGIGLGWLARTARRVEAGDLDHKNLELAREASSGYTNVRVRRFDAMQLPFEESSFDLLVLFEAIYYLPSAASFFREARRVLRPGGLLLVASVNPQWSGFNSSPFSTRYLTAQEFEDALGGAGFETSVFAAFANSEAGLAARLTRVIRRVAVARGWIPVTMRGKSFLKRIFYGRLEEIPRELSPRRWGPEKLVSTRENLASYRTLYVEARKPE